MCEMNISLLTEEPKKFVKKMGVTIFRSTSNMEICQSQYGGTTPQEWADLEGGTGGPDPWKITKYMGFYRK